MTSMMMDRGAMGMTGMGAGMAAQAGMMGSTGAAPAGMGMMMVPKCTMTFARCEGGMTIDCVCDDKTSAAMIQNLCTMMAGGMCSCCCMMNGMTTCCCNLTMAMCRCEATDMGVRMTCTSGDKDCCAMIQACCDCCTAMMKAGCTCCLMMNNMPVCCC
jgi:hypothetical protein